MSEKKLLSAKDILDADIRQYKYVEVPEWGGVVRVQSLTGKERDEFEAGLSETRGTKTKSNYKNFRAKMVALCAVDEEGKILFTNKFQIDALGDRSVAALQRVFNVCQALNRMTDEDVDSLTTDFKQEAAEASTSD